MQSVREDVMNVDTKPSGKPPGHDKNSNTNCGLCRNEQDGAFKKGCLELKGHTAFDTHPVRSVEITCERKTLDRLKVVTGRNCKHSALKATKKGMDASPNLCPQLSVCRMVSPRTWAKCHHE